MDGVQNATVNLTTEQALIEFYPSTTNTDQLIQRIHKLGYDAKPITNNNLEKSSRKEQELKLKRTKLMISATYLHHFCNAIIHVFPVHLLETIMNPWIQL